MSRRARTLVENYENEVFVSVACLWEMAIKIGTGKLQLAQDFPTMMTELLLANDLQVLNITFDHLIQVTTLPLHHRDPFDRMLIAQAMVEGIPILSADRTFDDYEVERIWN